MDNKEYNELLDRFAMAVISHEDVKVFYPESAAIAAYKIANAMMKEREKHVKK